MTLLKSKYFLLVHLGTDISSVLLTGIAGSTVEMVLYSYPTYKHIYTYSFELIKIIECDCNTQFVFSQQRRPSDAVLRREMI